MKRLFTLFLIFFLFVRFAKSQTLLFEADSFLNKKIYDINVIKNYSKEANLYCYTINIFNSSINNTNENNRLYVLKIFSDGFITQKKRLSLTSQIDSLNAVYVEATPIKRIEVKKVKPNVQKPIVEFRLIKNEIDEILELNKLINIDLKSQSMDYGKNDYQKIFDNLIIVVKDSIYYFDGSVLLQYFSLYDFEQMTPLQSNQTIINTKSSMVILNNLKNITGNPSDSIYLFPDFERKDYNAYRKMYLVGVKNKQNPTEFIFCRLVLEKGFHDYLHQTEYFTYKPRIGINGFTGIYVYKNGPGSIIMRYSDRIIDFEPLEYLKFWTK